MNWINICDINDSIVHVNLERFRLVKIKPTKDKGVYCVEFEDLGACNDLYLYVSKRESVRLLKAIYPNNLKS